MSISSSGFSSSASVSASARISRPSASVLPISTVCPERERSTSPGRKDEPEIAFSTIGISTLSRTLSLASTIACASPSTLAAPPMSFFMSSMPADGLMSSPPVSNVTPFPTSVTLGSPARPQLRSISRGASVAARPTAWIIGKFCLSSSSPATALTFILCRAANARISLSNAAGPRSLAGVLIRSRARYAASTSRATSARSAPAGSISSGTGFALLYRSNRYAPSRKPSAA